MARIGRWQGSSKHWAFILSMWRFGIGIGRTRNRTPCSLVRLAMLVIRDQYPSFEQAVIIKNSQRHACDS